MIIKDFAMLAANSARSKIYLQIMLKEGIMPEKCLVFGNSAPYNPNYSPKIGEKEYGIDLSQTLEMILNKSGIEWEYIEEGDINSDLMKEYISKLNQKYIIYSGYGGAILKPHLFKLGKEYLHVHAGILPKYRGSTTGYYSILTESFIGATSIFLNEKIDQGEMIYQESFPLPKIPVDIDYVFEPWTRAEVLVKTLNKYIENGYKFNTIKQSQEGTEIYYIIHPVLKHLAMKKVERAIRA